MGIEVLLALATAGAGNVARRVGQAAAKGAKAVKSAAQINRIGPFPVQAIDQIADLGRALDKPAMKTPEAPKMTIVPESSDKPKAKPDDNGTGNGKQAVARTTAQDRAEISRLSKEASTAKRNGNDALAAQKIGEARDILRPHIPKAPSSNWDNFIERLDVETPKDGAVFWSGDQKAAQKYAESIRGSTLEGTPGGNAINGWDELNELPWGKDQGAPPWSGDLWNGVSKKFANSATGNVSVVQPPAKLWDQGTVWHNTEKEIISDSLMTGKVTKVDIFTMDKNGSPIKLSPNYTKDLMNLEGIPR